MRISKEPEERKQEILETAIKLFSVNGFEKTSISDIAKEIGIAQGLCYRYFPSKDVLFQSAINEYSNILVANMTKNINIKKDSLKDILRKMILFAEQEDGVIVVVQFDKAEYDRRHNSRAVKKTLTIPEWLNEEALAMNINFSQVLQEALMEKVGIR